MHCEQLKRARMDRGWNQQAAATRLGVTQPYLSMLEKGHRSPSLSFTRKLMQVYDLPPTVLPAHELKPNVSPDFLASEMALLGYPGFAHLRRGGRKMNPAEFLLAALAQPNLEARVAEGLPWVVLRYPDMPVDWLVKTARANNLQNRLGFVVTLAKEAVQKQDLQLLEQTLADSKLAREDSFCKELNEPERRWLKEHSSKEAKAWNLLSDLQPDSIRYAA